MITVSFFPLAASTIKSQRTIEFYLGKQVDIELKNDQSVSGTIVEADEKMNVVLSAVKCINPSSGSVELMDSLSVCGSSIRYVHIPRYVSVKTEVSDYIKNVSRLQKSNQPRPIKNRAPRQEPLICSSRDDIVLN